MFKFLKIAYLHIWMLFLFVLITLSYMGCAKNETKSTDIALRVVCSFIITDYSVTDTALERSVIMELDTIGLDPGILPCGDVAGFIHLPGKDSINLVFDLIYGCQRTFQLLPVEVPSYMHKQGRAYFKIGFTIYGNYDSEMIFILYREYLSDNWKVYFYDNLERGFIKSEDFKIRFFHYDKESISPPF